MKKIIYCLSFFFLIVTSCGEDDSSPPSLTQEGSIIKKVVSGNAQTEYIYDGNKLSKIVGSNGWTYQYIYTGNLITQRLFYKNNILNEKDEYQYSAGENLIRKMRYIYSSNSATKTEYIYNSDGTISIKGYSGDFDSQDTFYNDRKVIFSPNGDVQKIERYKVINGVNQVETSVFTFDDKNNYEKNILGLYKLNEWEFGAVGRSSLHNQLSEDYTTQGSSVSLQLEYIYNSLGYPKSMSANFPSPHTVEFYYQ